MKTIIQRNVLSIRNTLSANSHRYPTGIFPYSPLYSCPFASFSLVDLISLSDTFGQGTRVLTFKLACEAVAYRGGGFGVFKHPPKFRSFDKAAFDCKLSGKCLVFLFQHPN